MMPPLTRKIRVCWMIDSLGFGGAERLFESYFRYLDREHFEWRVCVLQTRHDNAIAHNVEALGIPVDRVEVQRLRDLTAIPRMVRYLREKQFDFLHTQLEFSNTLGSPASAWLGIPSSCLLHTMDDPARSKRLYWRLRASYASLNLFADKVLAVSEAVRQHHIAIGAFKPDHIMTMYAGIRLEPFEPRSAQQKADIRAALGVPDGAKVITTTAILFEPKGIQYMIRALPRVLEAVPNAVYLVAGDGPFRPDLAALVDDLGLRAHVIFAGMRDDVPDLLAITDVFVLPTVYDALPTVLSEAMASRVPLVGSEVGGVPEMIQHGINGLLTRPADPDSLAEAVITILSDNEAAAVMAAAGRAIVTERFNVVRQARRLTDLYLEILEQRGKLPV